MADPSGTDFVLLMSDSTGIGVSGKEVVLSLGVDVRWEVSHSCSKSETPATRPLAHYVQWTRTSCE